LYLIWLPLTCMGRVKAADLPENEEFGRPTVAAVEDDGSPRKVLNIVNPMSTPDAEAAV
jgi:hypothetical protein